jgi:peptide/nickel transport system substrate-binding protein
MTRIGRVGRRGFVAGVAASLAGCTGTRGATPGRDDDDRVTLSIKTTPADADPYAIRIARTLSEHLEAVGIATEIVPMATAELLESVLVDHDFDIYVARHPGDRDPDFVRSLFHSRYAPDPGWRNPFGFDDAAVDSALEAQTDQRGTARTNTIRELVRAIADDGPMTAIAHPDVVHAVRSDQVVGWPAGGLQRAADLLGLRGASGTDLETFSIAITDGRPTRNRNPLAVTFRNRGLVTGLLYEPLARWSSDGIEPRLARDWEWTERASGSHLALSLTDTSWHDGEPVTSSDVGFTYRFLADTSLGAADDPVPAPRFRGRSELVEDVHVAGDRTFAIEFSASREAATRVLTVPILPQHVWEPLSAPADVAGLELFGSTTEALRWDNSEPVGSGPLVFETAETGTELTLSRFDDHFTDKPAYDRLRLRVAPSDDAAIELVAQDEVDATGPVAASLVSRIARNGSLSMVAGTTQSVYHLGYNVRRSPLDDATFRRAVGSLLDRRAVVDRVFDGFATPTTSPLAPDWSSIEPAPTDVAGPTLFPEGPGDLDLDAARSAFRAAGYRYEDGVLRDD